MRDWKLVLIGGAALILLGCSNSTAPSSLTTKSVRAHAEGDPCTVDGRTGYFVRSGNRLICQT